MSILHGPAFAHLAPSLEYSRFRLLAISLDLVGQIWMPNASGYAPKVYRVSDFELGEDYYFSEQTFPPIAQESRRIPHLSANPQVEEQ